MIGRPWFLALTIAVTLLALGIYAVMLTVTIPHLVTLAGGIAIFDMRPFGYTLEEARAIVAALGQPGIDYYTNTQHMLDAVYPLALAATLSGWLMINGRRLKDAGIPGMVSLTTLASLVAVIGAICDYGENGAVRMMLMTAPDAITAETVARASAMTIGKSVATTIAMTALLILLVVRFVVHRRQRSQRTGGR